MTTWTEPSSPIHLNSTSAGDPWFRGALTAVILTGTLVPWGTATSKVPVLAPGTYLQLLAQTSAGGILATQVVMNHEPLQSRHALMEVRRLSGLTWEQLAACFGVDRRSLHFWASGKPLSAQHLTRLERLLTLIRRFDHGSASANRAFLLRPQTSGESLFEMMARGTESALLEIMSPPSAKRPKRALPPAEDVARMPQSPAELIGAVHDPIHVQTGTSRVAKPRRASDKA